MECVHLGICFRELQLGLAVLRISGQFFNKKQLLVTIALILFRRRLAKENIFYVYT